MIAALGEAAARRAGGGVTRRSRSSSRRPSEVMAEVPRAGAEETDAAVARAPRRPSRAGARSTPEERARGAARARRRARATRARSWRRSRPATPASRSPTPAARSEMVVDMLPLLRGRAQRLLGDTIPVAGGVDMTFREPLGVVGLIVPWNFPLDDRLLEAGAGAGGREHGRAEAGRADAADRARAGADRPRGRASRGRPQRGRRARAASAASAWSSTRTSPRSPSPARPRSGRGIAAGAAETIKRVTLELGGKSANVIFADADLEAAAAAAPVAVFGNAGQDCCARSRILVERTALDEFMAALEPRGERAAGRRPARRRDTEMGPLISADQRETVASYVDRRRAGRVPRPAPGRARLLVRADRALPGLQRRPRRRARRSSARSRA